jgi:hypothetical protein
MYKLLGLESGSTCVRHNMGRDLFHLTSIWSQAMFQKTAGDGYPLLARDEMNLEYVSPCGGTGVPVGYQALG